MFDKIRTRAKSSCIIPNLVALLTPIRGNRKFPFSEKVKKKILLLCPKRRKLIKRKDTDMKIIYICFAWPQEFLMSQV